MKKSIIILGMLGFSLTYAQQDNNGKVGVNTETPSATLNVKSKTGTTSATKNLELENANSEKLVTVLDNGNVGVGTTTPTTKLDLVSNTEKTAFRMADGSQGEGKLLTSDENGNATWENFISNSYHTKFKVLTEKEIALSGAGKQQFPGIDSYIIPETGYYLVNYHSFLRVNKTGMTSFYFEIYNNGGLQSSDETYNYVTEGLWFNSHYNTTIYARKGDEIKFAIIASIGDLNFPANPLAERNVIEVTFLGK